MLDYSIFSGISDTDEQLFRTRALSSGVAVVGYTGADNLIKIPRQIGGKNVLAVFTFSSGPLSLPYKLFIPETVGVFMGSPREKGWTDNICISPDNHNFTIQDGLIFSRNKEIAFLPCDDDMEEVILPEEVKTIYLGAFYPCDKLKRIVIGKNVSQIANFAFPNTRAGNERVHGRPVQPNPLALSEIVVHEENENYASKDGYLYTKDMTTLLAAPAVPANKTYSIPKATVKIEKEAVKGNQGITRVTSDHVLSHIGQSAFELCMNLESICIAGAETIGEGAFKECTGLQTAELGQIGTIEKEGFYICRELDSVSVEKIGVIHNDAFAYCQKLKTIDFPEGLTTIGDRAFTSTEIKEANMPKSLTNIGKAAFLNCEGLYLSIYDSLKYSTAVTYERDWYKDGWACAEHRIGLKDGNGAIKNIIYMGKSNGTSKQYREAVTKGWSGESGFNFQLIDDAYDSLKDASEKMEVATLRLRFPEMLSEESKKKYADYLKRNAKKLLLACVEKGDVDTAEFYEQCEILKPNSIDAAIDECDQLKYPMMMAWLLELKNKQPQKVKKTDELKLPSKVKNKAEWAAHKDEPHLVKRYMGSDAEVVFPSEINGVAITGFAKATAKIPENYKEITKVVIPEGYTNVGENAFVDCEKLEKVELPKTMKRLEKNCFKNCKALKEIDIPASVEYIGDNAFLGSAIKRFELFADTKIGDYGLGYAEVLVARGSFTGNDTNNHYIGYTIRQVFSDGVVAGTGLPRSAVKPLAYLDIDMEMITNNQNKPLAGKNICILGDVKVLDKNDSNGLIGQLGGTLLPRFNKDVEMVISFEIDPNQPTIKKALERGLPVISEYDFLMGLSNEK